MAVNGYRPHQIGFKKQFLSPIRSRFYLIRKGCFGFQSIEGVGHAGKGVVYLFLDPGPGLIVCMIYDLLEQHRNPDIGQFRIHPCGTDSCAADIQSGLSNGRIHSYLLISHGYYASL